MRFEFKWQMDLPESLRVMLAGRAVEILKDVWDLAKKFRSEELECGRSSYGEMMFVLFDEGLSRLDVPEKLKGGDVWLMIPLKEPFNPYIEWMSENAYCEKEGKRWCEVLAEIEVEE